MTDSNQVSEATVARARRRVARMADSALLDWADVAVPGMQRHLDCYRRTGSDAHLTELAFAEMQFSLVLTEIMDRHAARAEEGLAP